MHVVWDTIFQKCASCTGGKVHIAKNESFIEITTSLVFALCFLPSAARSSKKIMSQGARFQGSWDFLAHFEVEGGRNFLFGMRRKIAWFHHVLSVSVVPSVSVESVPWSQMTC